MLAAPTLALLEPAKCVPSALARLVVDGVGVGVAPTEDDAVDLPAHSDVDSPVQSEDEDAKEDEEVWYEASDEEATLLAQADDLLAIISAELGATDSSADTAAEEREELFEELFGPEPTSDRAIDEEDFFRPLTLDQLDHGSSVDGVNSRRAMMYRPVPGVSFDD